MNWSDLDPYYIADDDFIAIKLKVKKLLNTLQKQHLLYHNVCYFWTEISPSFFIVLSAFSCILIPSSLKFIITSYCVLPIVVSKDPPALYFCSVLRASAVFIRPVIDCRRYETAKKKKWAHGSGLRQSPLPSPVLQPLCDGDHRSEMEVADSMVYRW